MSRCELNISFDRPEKTFVAGEEIKGSILIKAISDFQCEQVILTREWRAHGKGNTDKGGKDEIILSEETGFSSGDVRRYTFQMSTPPGPTTYHGHQMNVDWYLVARIKVSWAIDPKAEEEFTLLPPVRTSGGILPVSSMGKKEYRTPVEDGRNRLGLIISTVVFLGGLAWIMVHRFNPFDMIFGGFFLVIGALMGFFSVRNKLALMKLGKVQVQVNSTEVYGGDEIKSRIRIEPRNTMHLNTISAWVVAEEVVVKGSGKNKKTLKKVVHEGEKSYPFGKRISPGDNQEVELTLPVPFQAPPSFSASDNKLRWNLKIRVDVEGWTDWVEEIPITVYATREPHPKEDRDSLLKIPGA